MHKIVWSGKECHQSTKRDPVGFVYFWLGTIPCYNKQQVVSSGGKDCVEIWMIIKIMKGSWSDKQNLRK